MWIADGWEDYELLDCGGGEKLERWGKQILVRPDPQAIWETPRTNRGWRNAQGRYYRSSSGGGHWDKEKLPESWTVNYKDLKFQVKPMNFKHTGLFPEQAVNWDFACEKIKNAGRPIRVLNLFAYTGGATVACAAAGAQVCHVDAAKGMVNWARENARVSGLSDAPVRWIIDDCAKFVEREIRRGGDVTMDQLPQAARQCRVVVNATPLGMEGFPPFADLSFLGSLPAGAAVFDLIYAPRKTELYQAARARGLIAITGMELLVQQAILAFNHFTGAGLEQEATRRELLALVNET